MTSRFEQGSQNTHIAIFVPSLAIGGAQRVALNLAHALVDRGFNVDLVLQEAGGAFLNQVDARVRIINFTSPGIVGRFCGLKQYFQREQPTVLLSILDNINVASFAKHVSGVSTRVIVSLHINLPEPVEDLKTWIKPFLIRYSYRLADGIVAVSSGVAKSIASITGISLQQIHVIPNPITMPSIELNKISHPWLEPGQLPVILGAGRLVKDKDFGTLIRAFAIVRQQLPCRLMILGDGEQRPQLEALIRQMDIDSCVALPGFVENPYPYMAGASVFVLSSVIEAFGNVLVESMAVGTPVVATNCGSGPTEILEAGKYGRLVSIANPNELAEGILATLRDPLNAELLKQRAKAFAIERIIHQYVQVLDVSTQQESKKQLVDYK
ncbi:glycosyltransferase [Leptolyngbya sp. NIES-2104]|uniref:glycosyltransferase n=1 Tax=Leptolyngbya sp. NIES-2104 TaxID=1552121 RepID=UPI0006EC5A4A|nr:glycosyltransferase [Leptolyngbya sp. NIES-2104]GAQ00038.1 glycosyl transferase, group 1 [Leptolyngbya sp. NIES-2104]